MSPLYSNNGDLHCLHWNEFESQACFTEFHIVLTLTAKAFTPAPYLQESVVCVCHCMQLASTRTDAFSNNVWAVCFSALCCYMQIWNLKVFSTKFYVVHILKIRFRAETQLVPTLLICSAVAWEYCNLLILLLKYVMLSHIVWNRPSSSNNKSKLDYKFTNLCLFVCIYMHDQWHFKLVNQPRWIPNVRVIFSQLSYKSFWTLDWKFAPGIPVEHPCIYNGKVCWMSSSVRKIVSNNLLNS